MSNTHTPFPLTAEHLSDADKRWWAELIRQSTYADRIVPSAERAARQTGKVQVETPMEKNWVKTGISLILAFVLQGLIWDWTLSFGIVLMISLHELGHLYVARRCGVEATTPTFYPFFGAVISMRPIKDRWREALVGLGGPLFGSLAAFGALLLALQFESHMWQEVAALGFFINFINMLPMAPLDGGRIANGISKHLSLVGIGLLCVYLWHRPEAWAVWLILAFGILSFKWGRKAQRQPTSLTQKLVLVTVYLFMVSVLWTALGASLMYLNWGA